MNCSYTGEDVRTCDCGAHDDDSAAEAVAQAWMSGDTGEPADAPDDEETDGDAA